MSYDQRLTVWGVHRDIGIGSPRWMSLTEARATAMANYKTARKGGDPVAQRRKAKIPTFAEARLCPLRSIRPVPGTHGCMGEVPVRLPNERCADPGIVLTAGSKQFSRLILPPTSESIASITARNVAPDGALLDSALRLHATARWPLWLAMPAAMVLRFAQWYSQEFAGYLHHPPTLRFCGPSTMPTMSLPNRVAIVLERRHRHGEMKPRVREPAPTLDSVSRSHGLVR